MLNNINDILSDLKEKGNYRSLKDWEYINNSRNKLDLSSNDYLGISQRRDLIQEFFDLNPISSFEMSSVASRLLSLKQKEFYELESLLSSLYNKSALIFNSGYHINTGIISALGGNSTLIVADKLVHASIIDGIILSKSPFERFRHNDMNHLYNILKKKSCQYENIVVITESIFSMDGDKCDLRKLVDIKNEFKNVILYLDEAHAFGVFGKYGLGCAEDDNLIDDIDIIVGTFGKAAASVGAFAIINSDIREYLINTARSLIFSTAIPPLNCMWSKFIIEKIIAMDKEREHLASISEMLHVIINPLNKNITSQSQIVPLIVGSNDNALKKSAELENLGYIALPIRTPTVPIGTERIRFSLSAAISHSGMQEFCGALKRII